MINKTSIYWKLFRHIPIKPRVVMNIFLLCIFLCCYGCSILTNNIKIWQVHGYRVGDILNTDTNEIVTFDNMITNLSEVSIIYVGEQHSNLYHHKKQLEIIKALLKRGCNLNVGMEMFDYTYQSILDLWVSGKLSEKELLKLSHWYANWRFNFDLYRDVLNYVRDEKLKTICLNIPFHIPPKVATGGLESLADEDRKHLPNMIDLSCDEHKNYIMKIHKYHRMVGREDFDSFYEAQCIWEDFMAQSIVKNMNGDENNKMVILVGNGHIINKFGIPNRVQSKLKAPFKTVCLTTVGNSLNASCADYILFTRSNKFLASECK